MVARELTQRRSDMRPGEIVCSQCSPSRKMTLSLAKMPSMDVAAVSADHPEVRFRQFLIAGSVRLFSNGSHHQQRPSAPGAPQNPQVPCPILLVFRRVGIVQAFDGMERHARTIGKPQRGAGKADRPGKVYLQPLLFAAFAIWKTTVLFLKQERDTSPKKRLRMPASSSFRKMAVVLACACRGVPKGRRIGEVAPGRQGKARPLADKHSIAAAVREFKINREDFCEQQEDFGVERRLRRPVHATAFARRGSMLPLPAMMPASRSAQSSKASRFSLI